MATNGTPLVGVSKNIKQIGRTDLPGGGSVVIENGYAYVGHIDPPFGTSIVDVKDPKHPKLVAQLEVPEGIHSHKVRVSGDVMLINYERYKTKGEPQAGLKVFDISDKTKPREIAFYKTHGKGVHRFTFDGRYAYISPTLEGYVGNIAMILDMKNPQKPKEVSRWWAPGQWTAGGEKPTWKGTETRCHHPIRRGDRLYISYWHGGFAIVDITDMSKPKTISMLDWSPPYPCPTHTTLPLAPARRASLRQHALRHLVRRRLTRRRFFQPVYSQGSRLLHPAGRQRTESGHEQRCLPRQGWQALSDRSV